MINLDLANTLYQIDFTSRFKKQFKKVLKQNKDLTLLSTIIEKLANLEKLDLKYDVHELYDDKYYENCMGCHIKGNWLLIYEYDNENKIITFHGIGSHNNYLKVNFKSIYSFFFYKNMI